MPGNRRMERYVYLSFCLELSIYIDGFKYLGEPCQEYEESTRGHLAHRSYQVREGNNRMVLEICPDVIGLVLSNVTAQLTRK